MTLRNGGNSAVYSLPLRGVSDQPCVVEAGPPIGTCHRGDCAVQVFASVDEVQQLHAFLKLVSSNDYVYGFELQCGPTTIRDDQRHMCKRPP